jgi:hypothetical protein
MRDTITGFFESVFGIAVATACCHHLRASRREAAAKNRVDTDWRIGIINICASETAADNSKPNSGFEDASRTVRPLQTD